MLVDQHEVVALRTADGVRIALDHDLFPAVLDHELRRTLGQLGELRFIRQIGFDIGFPYRAQLLLF